MKHFLLIYDYVADYMERRTAYRPAHFALAQAAADRGDLFLAGACTDQGEPLGVLVFKAENREVVEDFAKADPYVLNGVATGWKVREWTTVLGKDALTKVAPAPKA
ncbi:MAG: YciI-like protein [Acidobacteriota bacterium]